MADSRPTVDDMGEARFKWKTLALWSLVFALVSLIGLTVVATITNAETLSVVALALAVLAFVVQIIVFIVQGLTASLQAADTAALNTQTLRALAKIEEKSEGTRETVTKMNDRIIEFALNKASLEAGSSGTTVPTLRVLERTKNIIESDERGVTTISKAAERVPRSPQLVTTSRPTSQSFLNKPLTETEATEVEQLLESLDLKSSLLPAIGLYSLGKDLLAAEQAGREGQAGLVAVNGDIDLHKAGLLRRIRVDWSDSPYFVLTDKGRLAAKALLITPTPTSEKILFWRREVEDFKAMVARKEADWEQRLNKIPVDE